MSSWRIFDDWRSIIHFIAGLLGVVTGYHLIITMLFLAYEVIEYVGMVLLNDSMCINRECFGDEALKETESTLNDILEYSIGVVVGIAEKILVG